MKYYILLIAFAYADSVKDGDHVKFYKIPRLYKAVKCLLKQRDRISISNYNSVQDSIINAKS